MMKHLHVMPVLLATIFIMGCTPSGSVATEAMNDKPFAIASASRYATEAGLKVIEQGGNAFDAAVAVAAVLNVTEPMMSGLGGYGSILIYNAKEDKVRFLNASGRFPMLSNSDLMREPAPNYLENRRGGKSISTPGLLNAWSELHSSYGSLPWDGLFKEAIERATQGFPVNEGLSTFIGYRYNGMSPYAKSIFGNGSEPLEKGDLLIQKDLAAAYSMIAESGATVFYQGAMGDSIEKTMIKHESFLRKADLEVNEAEWWEPISFSFQGYDVFVPSLPANSFPTLVNLGLMNELYQGTNPGSIDYFHLFAESTKESYKARLAFSFDPEVKTAPIDSLLAESTLMKWASNLSKDSASVFELPFKEHSTQTTHFVVVDREGNMVSATVTLGNLFGSGIMAEGMGFFLNNSMAYATYEPKGNPMDVFPGRRKLSGDSPAIIMKDGKPVAALGTPGGHTITQNVPQILIHLLQFGMTMQESIDAPKISFEEPNTIIHDEFLDESIIKGLEAKGHILENARMIGNAHGIRIRYDSLGAIESLEIGEDKRGDWVREK